MAKDAFLLEECQQHLHKQSLYTQGLYALTKGLLENKSLLKVVAQLVKTMGEWVAVEQCMAYRVDMRTHQLQRLAEWRSDMSADRPLSAQMAHDFSRFENSLAWLHQHRVPLISDATQMHEAWRLDWSQPPLHTSLPHGAMIWLPFLFDISDLSASRFYVLALHRPDAEMPWDAETIQFLEHSVALISTAWQQQQQREQMQQNDLRWQYAVEGAGDGVWDWDIGSDAIYLSAHWCQMLGIPEDVPQAYPLLIDFIHPEDRAEAIQLLQDHLAGLIPDYRAEFRLRRQTGDYVWVLARGRVMASTLVGEPSRIVGTITDIAEKKEQEYRAHYLAFFDTLTGLPNRALFQDRGLQALAQAKRDESTFVLLFLDLDGFKQVNDSLGHHTGDALLQLAADRLRHVIRDVDTVARWGGDEFVLLLTDIRADSVTQVIDRILLSLAQPYEIGEHVVTNVTASMGVSVFPQDGDDYDSLLKHADAAMYVAKAQGKNTVAFFDDAMSVALKEKMSIDAAARTALRKNEFYLVYQPKYSVATGRILGAEVLIRWQHPSLGLVPPTKFIPIVEENGIITEIGRWVLEESVKTIAHMISLGVHIVLSVNVSARQFVDADFAEFVKRTLSHYDVPGELLELELTESLLMTNIEQGQRVMRELTDVGVQWAVDDFGTGYSSLAYLRRLPLAKLKIDRSFVFDMVHGGQAVVRTIIRMAQSMNMSVVAEGVEEDSQLQILVNLGCDEVQGYLFSPPLREQTLLTLLKRPHSDPINVLNHRLLH